MHKAKLLTSLFFLIIGFWPIVPCAQDSEQYQEVLGWDLADTSGCQNECSGRGQCKGGACLCHCAFAGTSCELTMEEYCSSLKTESKISFKESSVCSKNEDVCRVLEAVPVDCGCRILFFTNMLEFGTKKDTWNDAYAACYKGNNVIKMRFPQQKEIKKIHKYYIKKGKLGAFSTLWLDPTIKGNFVTSNGTRTMERSSDFPSRFECVGTHYFRAGDTELEVD